MEKLRLCVCIMQRYEQEVLEVLTALYFLSKLTVDNRVSTLNYLYNTVSALVYLLYSTIHP